jgi:hypothetical protein
MKVMVVGNSMAPMIKRGDFIEIIPIKHCTFKDVRVGDIVSYWSIGFNKEGKHRFWHKGNVIHRIVNKTSANALIKGDNRAYIEKVPYDKINGKVRLLSKSR